MGGHWDPVGSQLPWTLPGLDMSLPLSGPAPHLLGHSLGYHMITTLEKVCPLTPEVEAYAWQLSAWTAPRSTLNEDVRRHRAALLPGRLGGVSP